MALLQVGSIRNTLLKELSLVFWDFSAMCVLLPSLFRTYRESLMHCYEVIPEGAVCKLYFDLEFHRPANEGLDGKAMISSLIEVGYSQLLSFQPQLSLT